MSNEWYTPAKYIEAAREVMGSIDLDPASCVLANQTVRATRYYTQEENGLAQDWKARSVWCNPPFSASAKYSKPQPLWAYKALREYEQGNAGQIILLMKADTRHQWFKALLEYPICFPFHRVYFDRPGKTPQELREGTCFVYLGPHESRFINTFSAFGRIARAVDSPVRAQVRQLELVS